jgi:hypothetical protein
LAAFIGALAFFLAGFFAAFFLAAFMAAFFFAGFRCADAFFFARFFFAATWFLLCDDAYYFFFLPPFFFAVFFAAFFFVAMLKLLLELTKDTALLPPAPIEPATQPPGGLPDRSNSSRVGPSQGREPDGNGHAAAGFSAVLGAGEGTVGAGACAA